MSRDMRFGARDIVVERVVRVRTFGIRRCARCNFQNRNLLRENSGCNTNATLPPTRRAYARARACESTRGRVHRVGACLAYERRKKITSVLHAPSLSSPSSSPSSPPLFLLSFCLSREKSRDIFSQSRSTSSQLVRTLHLWPLCALESRASALI